MYRGECLHDAILLERSFDERQQIRVDAVFLGRAHAVRAVSLSRRPRYKSIVHSFHQTARRRTSAKRTASRMRILSEMPGRGCEFVHRCGFYAHES